MKAVVSLLAGAVLAISTAPALAQTADEIVEKHLAATGGRAALAKLRSRVITGSVTLSTPGGELPGTIEVSTKPPNKSRTLVKVDLSAFGAGQFVFDQRFDGTSGYLIDSLNGNRDITGSQLEAMRNNSFPTPLLNYKDRGIVAELTGKGMVGTREVYVLRFTPNAGPATTVSIDAENFMLLRVATPLNVPPLGDIEQVLEFADFRDVDGVKVAYIYKSINPLQTSTATAASIVHDADIDDASFAKP
jgi:outer membrane lipoprotein-sorting protein